MWRLGRKATLADGGHTVVLSRRLFWQKTSREFLRSYAARVAALAIVALIIGYGVFVKADVYQFYPSSCLGNWENVENALGEPELKPGANPMNFTSENSARYAGGDNQIFCGNFSSGDSDTQIFQKATLKFVWAFKHPSEGGILIIPQVTDLGTPAGTSTASSSPDAANASSGAATSSVPLLPKIPDILPSPAPTSSVLNTTSSPAPAPSTSSPSFKAGGENAVSTFRFVRVARAQEITPPPAPASTTSPEVPAAATSSLLVVTSTPTTSTLEVPFDPVDPPSRMPELPAAEDDTFRVSFSLDGESWINLGTVNLNNWMDASFSMDIRSWEDLKKLQVSIKGLNPAVPVPEVFLDGIIIEVKAEQKSIIQKIFNPPPPPPPRPVVFDPVAKHVCVIDPFSNNLARGSSSRFKAILKPSAPQRSFTTTFGELPPGITGTVGPDPSSTTALFVDVNALSTAATGSFSLVFIYKENQEDGRLLPNFCQYNLIVE